MPIKKRHAKVKEHRITPDAIEAFKAGDYHALHAALGLRPWEASPLPYEVTALGVSLGEPPEYIARRPQSLADYRQAQDLRRQIEAAAKN